MHTTDSATNAFPVDTTATTTKTATPISVQTEDFDSAALVAGLRARTSGAAGAIVTFTGYVRDYSSETATRTLFLEHYPGMCERVLQSIVDEAHARWDVTQALVTHRVGELEQGEQIVFVAIASAHRGDAFRACEFVIDALKTRAPFWKRETLADDTSFWVQARASDALQAQSWSHDSAAPPAVDKDAP